MNENLSSSSTFDLRRIIAVVRRNWWILAGSVGICLVFGVGVSLTQSPLYESSTVVALESVVGVDGGGAVSGAEVTTQLEQLNSSTTLAQVQKIMPNPGAVTITLIAPEAATIRITGTSPTAQVAADTANAYATVFAQIVQASDLERNRTAAEVVQGLLDGVEARLVKAGENPASADPSPSAAINDMRTLQRTYQQQLVNLHDQAEFIAQGRVRVIDPASVPSAPIAQSKTRPLLMSLLLGLAIGILGTLLREHFDDTVKTATEFDDATDNLPMLGAVPLDRKWEAVGDTRLALVEMPESDIAESYRTIRTALQYVRIDDPVRIVQVTSPQPQDGKTTTAANLAIAMAIAGRSTLLIDLDLRKPRVHSFFGLSNERGFTTLMLDEGKRRKKSVVEIESIPRLSVLPSGPIPPNPSEVLESVHARDLIRELSGDFDVIVVDSPPILGLSDALVISSMVDSTILVARAGSVTKRALRVAIHQLTKVNAPLVGAVINTVENTELGGYHYGYGAYSSRAYGYGRVPD